MIRVLVLVSLLLCILCMSGGLGLKEDANMSSCNEKERQALLDVKANLNDLLGHLDDWGSQEELDCCTWLAVRCNHMTGHVIKLDLGYVVELYDLGFYDSRVTDLTSLTYLDLSQNLLGGVIPKSFGNCSSLLHLDLSQNLFSRTFPSFAGCSSLTNLSLAHNSLSGSMPDFTQCTSLKYLDLSSNLLSGNMPNSVCKLSNLEYVDVGHNSFDGSIPDFTQCTSLKYLDLSSNFLSGNMSGSVGQLTNLEYLDVGHNSLNGSIPNFLGCPSLWFLDMSSNHLFGNVPNSVGQVSNLRFLDFSSNSLEDSVPDWFWDQPLELNFLNISSNEIHSILPDMMYFFHDFPGMDLSNNHFNGRVPSLPSLAALNLSGNRFSGTLSFLCNFDSALTFLDLSNNSLSGSLPNCWMRFQEKLVVLNLSNNNLSGKIPSSLGFLYNLEALYLQANKFVGEVPMSLRNCRRLRFVDHGENKLSDIIPKWIGEELSELYVLVLGSNRFYGMLPSQVCWLYNIQVLDLSNNGLSGNIPRCFDNFTAMARKIFGGDKITNHSYSSFIGSFMCISLPLACPNQPRELAQFIDNAWVTWKGTERLFGRSGLQLLKSIDLSRNNLSGKLPYEITRRIPTGSQLQRFIYTSYSGNPQLCGPPLSPRCGLPPPPTTIVVGKEVVEEDEGDFWKSYYTGMGVGFVVAFCGICGALFLNRGCRHFIFALLSYMKDWIYVTVVVHFGKLGRMFRR
ncbi:hypothetical protein L1987_25085 [Smallanthus sonchifolius]|uniref:Uncharacterized protein n=1 Tax=Smallanthus sonchifolius TaxID=185202 RepID=A0ACB9INQ5_9ASTR|nr:hypothetical protein L1987_25085 [Smallanthus sonchifolius]